MTAAHGRVKSFHYLEAVLGECRNMITVVLRVLALVFALGLAGAPERLEAATLVGNLGGASGFGTLAMGRNDDGSSAKISLGSGFPYGVKLFSRDYRDFYINNNGNVTFNGPLGWFTPIPFPITNLPMLAPYWGDVDTRGGAADPYRNNVYYSTAIPGKVVITWNYVGYYPAATNKVNAFQLVMTDRSDVAQGDFDIEYRYEQLQWTTGSASGGSNGLGGTPAQMGYDAGDRKNYYRHPDSATADILRLTETSNVGEPGVWRFEVRGGTPNPVQTPNLLDVRLIETLNSSDIDVDPETFQVAPYSVSSGNGETVIEWRFATFPADVIKDLSFDVIFRNPQAGENRRLISRVELLYTDANGNAVRTELGPEYVSVHPAIYQIVPTTDRASYGPDETVQITSTMTNLTTTAGTAAVRLSVQDANGAPVAVLGTTAAQTVAGGGTAVFTGLNFPTGTTYAGGYSVLAELLDVNERVITAGSAPFTIGAAGGPSVSAQISTDKQVYSPFDTVRLSERVKNLLSNAALDDLRVTTTVTNPDGSVRFAQTDVLQQLPPSALKDYAHTLSLASAAAGQYQARLTVTRADGTQLAQANTQFSVASTADTGVGLVGRISANPVVANMGQTVTLNFGVTNAGNSALDDLPLTVTIVDPASQQVVTEHSYSTTLATGAAYDASAQWVASGDTGATYAAVLTAAIGGKTLTLAQATFTVLKLDVEQTFAGGNRVLVWVGCDDDEMEVSPGDGAQPGCITSRAETIEAVLGGLGVMHILTTDEAAFKLAFRSGLYNTYWLSGKTDKLHADLAEELREAVFRGDGYLIDGDHDERNKTLDEVAGIRYLGKLGKLAPVVTLTDETFGTAVLSSAGRALRVALAGGATAATVPDNTGAAAPAIVRNDYGRGRAVFFGFDLVESLATEAWAEVLGSALDHVAPEVGDGAAVAGSVVPLTTMVTNQGPATDVHVRVILPPGAAYLDSTPEATVEDDEVRWAFRLDEAAREALELLFVAPTEAGSYAVTTTVSTVKQGVTTPYGDPLVETIEVRVATELLAEVRLGLDALVLQTKADQRARDTAAAKLEAARQALAAGEYEAAIRESIAAIDALRAIEGADVIALREGLAAALHEIEWRWVEQQP